jgi:hypothetical protein
MALPIKETPILYGKHAEKFLRDIAANIEDYKNNPEKYKEAIERAKKAYDKMKEKYPDFEF